MKFSPLADPAGTALAGWGGDWAARRTAGRINPLRKSLLGPLRSFPCRKTR